MKTLLALVGTVVIGLLAQAPGQTKLQTGGLSRQEQRGKDIYLGNEPLSGSPAKAIMGNPPVEVTRSMVACANCHGEKGKGVPNERTSPADIAWDTLAKPSAPAHSPSKTRPAYTERTFIRAVCMGIDSAGNKLLTTMPRYEMSRDDIYALISYLKRLEAEATEAKKAANRK